MSRRFSARILLVLGIAMVLPAFAGSQGAGPKGPKKPGVATVVLADGQYSDIASPLEIAVRDQDTWEALWAAHAEGTPPPVQFDSELVVAVFIGQRPTTAFSVRIERVVPLSDGGYLVQYVEEEVRNKRVAFADVITTSFVIVTVPLTDGQVAFEGTKVIVKKVKEIAVPA
jgi:hypothetical protein